MKALDKFSRFDKAGKSGGPLVDPRGVVIGITTFKISSREGLGFAVDANELRSAFPTVFK
jgi:S1-C subfamily serine protease